MIGFQLDGEPLESYQDMLGLQPERGGPQDWLKDEHNDKFVGARPGPEHHHHPKGLEGPTTDPAFPPAVLGRPYPVKAPHPVTGWAEPASRVTLKSGIKAEIQSQGDAVPGGYNGSFIAYEAESGKKMGWMDYQTATGDPVVLIAMNEVVQEFWGRGVSDALLSRLMAEFPGHPIAPGMMTESGMKWWDRVKRFVIQAPGRAKDSDDHYYGAWSGGSKKEGGHPAGGSGGKAAGGRFEQYRLPVTDPQAGYAEYMALNEKLGHIDWAKGLTPEQNAIIEQMRVLDAKPKSGDLADGPPLTPAEIAAIAADPELMAGVMASRYGIGYREFTINRVVGTDAEGKPVSTDEYTLTNPEITTEMRTEMLAGLEAAYLSSPKAFAGVDVISWGRTPSPTAGGQYVMGEISITVARTRGNGGIAAVVVHEVGHGVGRGQGPVDDVQFNRLDSLPTPPSGFGPDASHPTWRDDIASVIAWEKERLLTKTNPFSIKMGTDAIARYESYLSYQEVRVSNYAGLNPGEHYAEMYRMFVLSPKEMLRDFPLQYGYMVGSR
jgi:hypothetical protein